MRSWIGPQENPPQPLNSITLCCFFHKPECWMLNWINVLSTSQNTAPYAISPAWGILVLAFFHGDRNLTLRTYWAIRTLRNQAHPNKARLYSYYTISYKAENVTCLCTSHLLTGRSVSFLCKPSKISQSYLKIVKNVLVGTDNILVIYKLNTEFAGATQVT